MDICVHYSSAVDIKSESTTFYPTTKKKIKIFESFVTFIIWKVQKMHILLCKHSFYMKAGLHFKKINHLKLTKYRESRIIIRYLHVWVQVQTQAYPE